jgi:mono/diheme cytochrome c family protein
MKAVLACVLLAAPAAAQPTGAELYMEFCATCHGVAADGNGPMAPILLSPPPDLTGLSERAGGEFPVFGVVQRIDGRDPLLAHGGEMPIWGGIFEGEPAAAVATTSGQPVLTSDTIAKVVEYLRTVQR